MIFNKIQKVPAARLSRARLNPLSRSSNGAAAGVKAAPGRLISPEKIVSVGRNDTFFLTGLSTRVFRKAKRNPPSCSIFFMALLFLRLSSQPSLDYSRYSLLPFPFFFCTQSFECAERIKKESGVLQKVKLVLIRLRDTFSWSFKSERVSGSEKLTKSRLAHNLSAIMNVDANEELRKPLSLTKYSRSYWQQ